MRDVAFVALDHPACGLLIGAHDLPQFLGIESFRQGGRADKVAKHYGDLPSLRFAGARGRRRGNSGLDRLAQGLARTHGQTEALEVGLVEVGQVFEVELLGLESRGIVAEAQPVQPASQLAHSLSSGSARPERPTATAGPC